MGAVWDHDPAARAPLRKSPGLSFIDAVPPFLNGGGFVQGAYLFPEGPKEIKEHVLFEMGR